MQHYVSIFCHNFEEAFTYKKIIQCSRLKHGYLLPFYESISTDAQYVILQIYFSLPSFTY
jgi:hypothetical protein